MKILLQILYTESWSELAEVVLPNMIDYCKVRGYSYSPHLSPEPYEGFDKISTIYDTFNLYDIDVIFSRDMDTLITNFHTKVEDFLEDGKDFYITKDFNGINAGSFIIKKTAWSKFFITYLESKKGQPGMYCEQNAIEAYMAEFPDDEKIKILPHPSINSYHYPLYPEIPPQTHEQGQWQMGDFVLHLPGVSMEQRLKILSSTPIVQ